MEDKELVEKLELKRVGRLYAILDDKHEEAEACRVAEERIKRILERRGYLVTIKNCTVKIEKE